MALLDPILLLALDEGRDPWRLWARDCWPCRLWARVVVCGRDFADFGAWDEPGRDFDDNDSSFNTSDFLLVDAEGGFWGVCGVCLKLSLSLIKSVIIILLLLWVLSCPFLTSFSISFNREPNNWESFCVRDDAKEVEFVTSILSWLILALLRADFRREDLADVGGFTSISLLSLRWFLNR